MIKQTVWRVVLVRLASRFLLAIDFTLLDSQNYWLDAGAHQDQVDRTHLRILTDAQMDRVLS